MVSPLKQQHIKSLSVTLTVEERPMRQSSVQQQRQFFEIIPWQLGKQQERVVIHIRSELSYILVVHYTGHAKIKVVSFGQQHNRYIFSNSPNSLQPNKVALDLLTIKPIITYHGTCIDEYVIIFTDTPLCLLEKINITCSDLIPLTYFLYRD